MNAQESLAVLQSAQEAMHEGRWAESAHFFGLAAQRQADNAGAWHNLGLSLLALGNAPQALKALQRAYGLNPRLWQSRLLQGRAHKMLGQVQEADASFAAVMQADPTNGTARLARADLAMNVFGTPLQAVEWVKPLLGTPEHGDDAELTTLMASLYDRDESAQELNDRVMDFSRRVLRLAPMPRARVTPRAAKARPRVGLISPLFCASPVYFLTIAAWREEAKARDVVVFNRGHKADWATQAFKDVASEWHDVQEMDATRLAQALQDADLDVLYDLGGWMDPVGLKALSIKPARHMFKWVGGQSITTGLDSFDGWIGDEAQSPAHLQSLYTEPLHNIPGGYAIYTPPDYMPAPQSKRRLEPVVFANPAKLSRAFLRHLQTIQGKKVLVHQQFQHAQARDHVLSYLDASEVEFVMPRSHHEALEVVGQHAEMLDTFPYSSGLTAREAKAMGVKVRAKVGTLFCERHCAPLTEAAT